MKERKKSILRSNKMSRFQRREQVVLSRLRIGYTRATHRLCILKEIIAVCETGNAKDQKLKGIESPSKKTSGKLDYMDWQS
jgi:hypothetical protein